MELFVCSLSYLNYFLFDQAGLLLPSWIVRTLVWGGEMKQHAVEKWARQHD